MKKLLKISAVLLAFALVLPMIFPAFAEEDEIEYKETTITFDLSSEAADTNLSETELSDYFDTKAATGESVCAVGEGGIGILEKYAQINTTEIASDELFQNPYVISLNFGSTSKTDAGIYVRAIDPTLTSAANSILNSNISFWFYEWDWYKEHGGTRGESGTGGSGLKISFDGKNIVITLKTHVDDGLGIFGEQVKIAAPEGFEQNGLNPVKITDDAKSHIEVFVCDTLIATLDYSGEPEAYEDTDVVSENEVLYYKNAVVKGADGTELLNINNARIAAEIPLFAIGNRNNTTKFSDLQITVKEPKKPATPEPTEAPATDEPTEKAEDPATDKPADKTTENATAAPTEGGESSATEKNSGDNNAPKKFNPVPLIIGICAAIVVVSVIVIIVSGKKKKS